jgi:hypothetical protein
VSFSYSFFSIFFLFVTTRAQKQREWDAQILRWEEQKRSELYKKFFVGNLKWKDITLEGNAHTHTPHIIIIIVVYSRVGHPR